MKSLYQSVFGEKKGSAEMVYSSFSQDEWEFERKDSSHTDLRITVWPEI